jgi:PilZ domain
MGQSSEHERRRSKRRNLAFYMLVLDANTRGKIGHLVDITPEGLLMDSEKALPLQKDFRLLLDIPPDVDNKPHISFTARSIWCRPDAIVPSLFDIGFSVVGISTEDATILKRLSEKYSEKDGYTFPWK